MGRTSKFSFPIPGRKHTTKEKDTPSLKSDSKSSSVGNNLSKAQRILGTDNDLNIDYPTRDGGDHPWKYPGSRSSGMSISISESTQSTNESGSIHEYQNEQWDRESGVFPRNPRLHGKASSTLLGQQLGKDGLTPTSSVSGRLRNEDSSSTLKSYYDRQKSPLSISQQTSASSARDLALRKGYPPVIQRSPLLQVESSLDPFDVQFSSRADHVQESSTESYDKSRKKPARLDLSMLFARSKRPGSMTPSPSSASTNASRDMATDAESGRRKLKKSHSKESIQSQQRSVRSTKSHNPQAHQSNGTLLQTYDHYEHMPVRSPHMDRIPESRVYDSSRPKAQSDTHPAKAPRNTATRTNRESYASNSEHQPFSWKNVRASMMSPPWESSSAASISSRNTKTSRHTNNSVLSNSDLLEKSVLSLSSDSEDDDFNGEPIQSPNAAEHTSNPKTSDHSRLSARKERDQQANLHQHSGGLIARNQSKKVSSHNLEVPPSRSSGSRTSGVYAHSLERDDPSSRAQSRTQQRTSQKEKRVSRTSSSLKSDRSLQEPTPPLSPTSIEFRQTSERSSRFMAVTKQEEALLEALRQKRARMREDIINEHEIAKSPSPPRIPPRHASRVSRNSAASSVNTIRGSDRRVLLYLDTPAANTQLIDTAEPSPDNLSDFMSYSDDDSTPRTSYVPQRRSQPRPESLVTPQLRFSRSSPMTPPSAARLSAVGVGGFNNERTSSKKRNTGVRFVDHPADDSRLVNAQDFLLDENEGEVLWRL